MKKRFLLRTIFAILILWPITAYSTDITFTSSGTITDGNVYDNVYVENDGTVVNMSGGQINNSLWTSDDSTFNMTDGLFLGNTIDISPVSTFNFSDDGTIDINGGLTVNAGATVNIFGGNISADILKTYPASSFFPDSIVNINGGNIDFELFDILGGEINIYRGLLNVNACNIHLYPYKGASINIYGNDFNYNPGTQILTGCLLDNNSFTIKEVSQSEYERFNLIPEPMSLLLFGFGLLTIRYSKK